jgi:hypothetical protein
MIYKYKSFIQNGAARPLHESDVYLRMEGVLASLVHKYMTSLIHVMNLVASVTTIKLLSIGKLK